MRTQNGVMAGQAELFELRRQARIDAPREVVFDVLLKVNEWWKSRLRSGSAVSLEPWVGGRFMEDWGGESGALYGFVTFIERPKTLVVSRPMGLRGGAASSWTIELDVQGAGVTMVRVHHAAFGPIDPEARRAYASDWEACLDALAKACAERDARAQTRIGLSA
jgi:uncharacterized protein YndB with AHSA1/START domain